jgi:hypothetical protein
MKTTTFIILTFFVSIQSNFLNAQTTWTSANSNLSTVDWTSRYFQANGLSGDSTTPLIYARTAHAINTSNTLQIGSVYQNNFYGVGFEYVLNDVGTASRYISTWHSGIKYRSISFNTNGQNVELNYDGIKKLATTSTGIDITGNLSLVNTNGILFNGYADGNWKIYRNLTADFTKQLATGSTLNINAHYGPGEGFAIGCKGGNSYYEILGSGPTHFFRGKVGIGTTDPGNYELAVEGTIGAREVKVTLDTWSDFVFEDDYNLQSLSEVETYIKQNKHLPDIPSEAEVKENGVSLGEMDSKLLQKIEELMLHTIDQQKLIDKQQKDLDVYRARYSTLEIRLSKLEGQQ